MKRPLVLMAAGFLLAGSASAGQAPAANSHDQPHKEPTIRLTDRTTFTGAILQMNDDSVIIRLPRQRVATINGQPLPTVLGLGVAAPAFTATDATGQTRMVGGSTGKVTLLHFWVHWCPHCRSDAPQIQALQDRFHDDPRVQVLAVNLDDAAARATVDQFIQEHHVTYPVIVAAEQQAINLPELYQVSGFPLTYVIDAKGIIRWKISGSFAESHKDLGAVVEGLLPDASAATR